MQYKAILFDTRSIQRYIFAGNRLKTNIGASYLVERVFDDVLLPAVRDVLGQEALDDASWESDADPRWDEMAAKARVGYIGGGNALLLFRSEMPEETLRAIVAAFTKQLLVRAPGLCTGAAIGVLDLDAKGRFLDGKDLTALVHRLKEVQNTSLPAVHVPYTGLTLSCPVSGEAADAWDDREGRFYSWEVEMKLRAARSQDGKTSAEESLREKLASVLPHDERADFLRGFAFPTELSDLGQKRTENDIAVVHIDGNNMGQKFQACDTLTKRKEMSRSIRHKTIAAFSRLVQKVVADFDWYDRTLSLAWDAEGRRYLPLRPLILGGDDMTFVCAAKVAIPLARLLMEWLKEDGLDTCGGLTIFPAAYPFFRAYEMTEALCGAAKGCMRALASKAGQPAASCWLDYAILHGEQPPTLAQFRAEAYEGVCGSLHFGPFRVDADETEKVSLAALMAGVRGMCALPRTKVKELRRVLLYGEEAQRAFLTQLRHLQGSEAAMQLPDVPAWKEYEKTLWAEGRTPYMDAIELMDYVAAEGEV